ncbi:helix-turn-helix transcriptional regulator [Variovorax sp. ZT4R33]|uniref:helix-turn-helix transcriptional regulator n=1 Tax=Variovorax sp. ZT4R33 TaxID=3443743 RepID=UPI003F47C965
MRSSSTHLLIVRGGLAPWQARVAQELLSQGQSCAEAAAACRLSRGHFGKAFKQSVGHSPHAWLTAQRIEQARRLLLARDIPVAEIAVTCGFADQSHFTRTFAKEVGVPPVHWRRAHLQAEVGRGHAGGTAHAG